ncbi:hypothetical protein YN1HA_17930 [Sulfurisphaera ohwakuensis]
MPPTITKVVKGLIHNAPLELISQSVIDNKFSWIFSFI